jgi:hypothetical protein
MRKHELTSDYHDYFEYYGNTEIERIRQRAGRTLRRDWIIFDTVEEAMDFFNSKCGEFVGHYA